MSAPLVGPITRVLKTLRGLPVSGRRSTDTYQLNSCGNAVSNVAVPPVGANAAGTSTCSATATSRGAVGYTLAELTTAYNGFFPDNTVSEDQMQVILTTATKRGVLFKGGCLVDSETKVRSQTYFINNAMTSFNPLNAAYLASCADFLGNNNNCVGVCDSDNPGQYGVSNSMSSGIMYNGGQSGIIGSELCTGCAVGNLSFGDSSGF